MAVPARVITKAQRGSNFGTVTGALVQTVARSAREEPQASGWRAHGRKCLPAGVQARRVPGRMLACWSNGVFGTCGPRGGRQSPIELACLRQSPIEQALHGRDAHECVQHPGATAHSWCERKTLKTVPYRFNAAASQPERGRGEASKLRARRVS